jgi:two-component system nitrate/nitrite response regulator NarL
VDGDGVLIVEDHVLLAQAVAAALADHGVPAQLIAPAELDAAVSAVRPGTLVLLDLRLGGGRDGGQAVAPLVEGGATVVVVTGTSDPTALARALEDGAATVVHKHQPFSDLVATVLAVRAGGVPASEHRRRAIMRAAAAQRAERDSATAVLERLSPRESEVLDRLCEGLNAMEIAALAGVSLATVRAQIRSVLAKLEVSSQLQAVARAHQLRNAARGRGPQDRAGAGEATGRASR